MDRRRNLWISLAAALLAGALVYGVYVLQLKQVSLQQTVNVAVPKSFISAGRLLQASMFQLKPIYKASLGPAMYTNLHQLAGMEALMPLGKGEPVLSWKLARYPLIPAQGQATFQIPKSYILSIADGIRAGDEVKLYASGSGEPSSKLFKRSITVASVKASDHQEVDNPQDPNIYALAQGNKQQMYASRLHHNADIQSIDLNLSEDQWLTIDRLCKGGSVKLIIAFAPATFDRMNQNGPGKRGGGGRP